MISGLLFVNLKGEVVISRYFRDNVSRAAVDAFRHQVIAAKKTGVPIINIDKTSFLYSRVGDVFFVAVTKHNANPAIILQFMYKMLDVFKAYFGKGVDEENIRNNFVIIYELLDECMDFGYPQITAINILTSYIKNGDVKDSNAGNENNPGGGSNDAGITSEITGNVDWRAAGKYRYRKNEVFIDVLEAVNLLMSNKGVVLRADVSGKIVMKTYLTGMPECKFGLNDKLVMDKEAKNKPGKRPGASGGIAIDDVTFHRCVKLGQFDHDRTISFIPPDGEFEVMKYRITDNVNLPFRVIPVVTEHGRGRVEYEIKVKGNFSSKLFATHVVLRIPTPNNVAKCNLEPGIGKAKYNATQKCIVWKIAKFPGDGQYLLKGEAKLLVAMEDKTWSRPPITMDFQVPMFTASGLHVRFLKVFERSNYETIKWVRYMTRAGQYQIRI